MINPSVVEDNTKQLDPFNIFQTMIIANKIADPSTNNSLPRNLMELVGAYWLFPIIHAENVECLSALVEFLIKRNDPLQIDEIKGIATAVKSAAFTPNAYETTFARVITLIGDRKEQFLRKAAQDGDTLAVVQLLKIPGIDVNAPCNMTMTALMWAACNGHTSVVTALLKISGILINFQSNNGWTALMWAAYHGHASVVTVLLQKNGILVNAQDKDGNTALLFATWDGYTSVVTALLQKDGILVDAQDTEGWTALRVAALEGHMSIMHQLCLKQLLDAPYDQGHTLFEALTDQISRSNCNIVFTMSSLCNYLLESVEALPTADEKITLLEKALSGTHAFSKVMRYKQRIKIEAALTALKPSQDTQPVIFSTAPVAGLSSNANILPRPQ